MSQSTPHAPTPTEGRTASRRVAVLTWSLVALSLVLLILLLIAPPLGYEGPADDVPWFADVGILTALIAFAVVGALIVSRRPSNAIGWSFLVYGPLSLATFAAEAFSGDALARSTDAFFPRLGAWASNTIGGPVVIVLLGSLMFLFPDGRPASARWRTIGRIAAVACSGYIVLFSFAPGPLTNTAVDVSVINPLGIEAFRPLRPLIDPRFVILVAFLIVAALSLVLRFRRSRGIERQQIKWLAFAGVLIAIAFVLGPALFWRPSFPEFAWPLTFAIVILSVPIACGMAILRYRLYDIDRIISRTLGRGSTAVRRTPTRWLLRRRRTSRLSLPERPDAGPGRSGPRRSRHDPRGFSNARAIRRR